MQDQDGASIHEFSDLEGAFGSFMAHTAPDLEVGGKVWVSLEAVFWAGATAATALSGGFIKRLMVECQTKALAERTGKE